jgi:hypothetical protein
MTFSGGPSPYGFGVGKDSTGREHGTSTLGVSPLIAAQHPSAHKSETLGDGTIVRLGIGRIIADAQLVAFVGK